MVFLVEGQSVFNVSADYGWNTMIYGEVYTVYVHSFFLWWNIVLPQFLCFMITYLSFLVNLLINDYRRSFFNRQDYGAEVYILFNYDIPRIYHVVGPFSHFISANAVFSSYLLRVFMRKWLFFKKYFLFKIFKKIIFDINNTSKQYKNIKKLKFLKTWF
jgi:hypothetical protein